MDPACPAENIFLILLDAYGHWSDYAYTNIGKSVLITLVSSDIYPRAMKQIFKVGNIGLGWYLEISLTTFGTPDGATYRGQLNFSTAANLHFFHMPLERRYIAILT